MRAISWGGIAISYTEVLTVHRRDFLTGLAVAPAAAAGAIEETFWATRRLLEVLAAELPVEIHPA